MNGCLGIGNARHQTQRRTKRHRCDVGCVAGAGRGKIIPKLLELLALSCLVIECYMIQ
jgi:hypothetical protein